MGKRQFFSTNDIGESGTRRHFPMRAEVEAESLRRHIPQRDQLWMAGLIWTNVAKEEQYFILSGVDTYSGYRFAFPVRNASVKTAPRGLTGVSCTVMLFPTALLLRKELTDRK